MTVCYWIKTARVNCPSHLRKFAEEITNEKPNEENDEARMKKEAQNRND